MIRKVALKLAARSPSFRRRLIASIFGRGLRNVPPKWFAFEASYTPFANQLKSKLGQLGLETDMERGVIYVSLKSKEDYEILRSFVNQNGRWLGQLPVKGNTKRSVQEALLRRRIQRSSGPANPENAVVRMAGRR